MPFADELGPVVVVDYQVTWPLEFARLAEGLRTELGALAISLEHVGSTSIPGLPAKDCIDIQVTVASPDAPEIAASVSRMGYRLRPEAWNRTEITAGHEYRKLVFAPPIGARACNVHIRRHGELNARFALLFRDYLRANPAAREAWGAFKQRLAATVTDLADYGQIKAPATELLMQAAERWASDVGWVPWGWVPWAGWKGH